MTAAKRVKTDKAAYSLAAGAAVAAVCNTADAEVHYSLSDEISIDQGFSQSIDFDGDDYQDAILKNYVFLGGNYQGVYVQYFPGKVVGFSLGLSYASALDAGVLLDDSSFVSAPFQGSLSYGPNNPNAEFTNAQNKFLGLAFPINAQIHYGWIRVSIDNEQGTFIIHDWAYETEVGVGITTGDDGLPGTPGDFNGDLEVDAADYAVWRNQLGGTGAGLLGDGGVGEVVDEYDHDVWRFHYGNQYGVPAAGVATPEPLSLGLLAAGALGLAALRRARQES